MLLIRGDGFCPFIGTGEFGVVQSGERAGEPPFFKGKLPMCGSGREVSPQDACRLLSHSALMAALQRDWMDQKEELGRTSTLGPLCQCDSPMLFLGKHVNSSL